MEPLAFPSEPSPDASNAAGERGTVPPPQVAVAMKPEPLTLAALFEAEESPLLRFALGLVGRRSVAEELVQETFLRLHQVWEQVENPRAWLYRSLRNLALNHLRDRPRETELVEATESARTNADADPPVPPDELGRLEAVGMVRLLLAELPDDDRALIRLKYHDDLKYREISARTGVSVGNVGYRLHHLLKQLADALRRAGIEGSQG
jgi:RNA polymerase sigma-70 factor (ECF subfamily)